MSTGNAVAQERDDYPLPIQKNGKFELPWRNEETGEELTRPNVFNFHYKCRTCNESPQVPSQEVLDTIVDMKVLPIDKEKLANHPLSSTSRDIQVTWLGHASCLVQLPSGLNILFDPVFSERIGPIARLGLKRFRRCPITVEELPHVDVVCISHDHYDHLDRPTVVELYNRFGTSLNWFVPLGMDTWLRDSVHKSVKCFAFNWWDNKTFEIPTGKGNVISAQVEFLPAQHWGIRGNISFSKWSTDENTRLWGGWIVKSGGKSVYHAGDTGYCKMFKSIGKRHGPVDLAMIPIGAYTPREMLWFQHVNPSEAVRIHQDVQSKQSIGIHWGTFELTREHYLEPPNKLQNALKEAGLKTEEFITMKHGETRMFHDQSDDGDDVIVG